MTDDQKETPVMENVAETPKKDNDIVITTEELEKLVGAVKAKAPVDNKEIYERALNEARAEFERAQNQRLETLAKKAESERITKLEAEIAALKAAPVQGNHTRKGISNTTNPFTKSEDGKLGIRTDEFEQATKRFLNPNAR
jgi:hypothetical protein